MVHCMYLYRQTPGGPLVPHNPEQQGYPCDYIGGDSGPVVVARDFRLHLDLGKHAIFQHTRTEKYFAALQIGSPSMLLCGDDWRQEQAHIKTYSGHRSGMVMGPFTFYDLVFLLEPGLVTPREVISAGYFGCAVHSLRGHVREPACSTTEDALALLALFQ
jgi:hypothetical protein